MRLFEMEIKKKAIYVHGLGSGAASTTVDIVRKEFSNYEWTAVEVNEDPVASVDTINRAIAELHPGISDGYIPWWIILNVCRHGLLRGRCS